MSRPRYWLAGTLIAGCLALSANAAVVNQVVNTVAVGGITGLGTGIATALGVNVGSAGAPVVLNGALGTPSSGTATNLTGLPIAGLTGLGTGVGTTLGQNVSGSGSICLTASCSMTTPVLGVAAATSINKVTITAPASSATLTLADGSSLVRSGNHSLTLTSAGTTDATFPTGTISLAQLGANTFTGSQTLNSTVFMPGITSSAVAQTGYICYGASVELIRDSVTCLVSSGRFKRDIAALDRLSIYDLRPVAFRYNADETVRDANTDRFREGLIAEQVAAVNPQLVGFERDGVTPRSVDYNGVIAELVLAAQQHKRAIEALGGPRRWCVAGWCL